MTEFTEKPLRPGDTIGILGGGQLGRMLALSASKFGLKTIILEPGKNCPAAQLANIHIEADYDDMDALKNLVDVADVVTYEFENIPLKAVNFLQENIQLYPDPLALKKSQDRLTEKDFIRSLGIATAPYHPIERKEDLADGLAKIRSKGILKTRRFGYDGKGQVTINSEMSKEELFATYDALGEAPSILEGFITFSSEISVIIARTRHGETACFDPAENVHKDGILSTSTVPASINQTTLESAKSIAGRIAEALDYVGVMGVEFFVQPDGALIVNEIAPRVHNSGHWTEAACTTSQFDQHIRAISGWPLGSTERHSDCKMVNLIGDDMDQVPQILQKSATMLHLYGKEEARKGRKMGHYTSLK